MGITAASENLWDCSGTTLKTIDPATAINQTLAGLDQKPDFTILLAHIPKRNLEDLLINVKGIDLVLGADGYSLTREVININGTTICYPGKQGQFMCDMSFTSTSNSFEFRQMEMIRLTGEMAENREIRKIVDRALDSVDKLKSKTETD